MHRRRFEIQKKNDTYLLSRFIEDQLACFDDHLQLQAHVIMLLKVKYTAHYTKERLILTLYRHRSRGYCCLFMRQSNNQSIRPNRITLELISIWCRIYESVNRASIASVNDLPPIRRQAIFWTNARLSSLGTLGTYLNEIFIKIQNFHFRKCIWKYRLRNDGQLVEGEMS